MKFILNINLCEKKPDDAECAVAKTWVNNYYNPKEDFINVNIKKTFSTISFNLINSDFITTYPYYPLLFVTVDKYKRHVTYHLLI